MRSDTPLAFISSPARMNSGTASNGKESIPPISRCGAVASEPCSNSSQATPMIPSEKATGVLPTSSASQPPK
jgi:hypothetical protein